MEHVHLAMLVSDWLIYGLLALGVVAFFYMRKQPHLREPWRRVAKNKLGMMAFVVLSCYVMVGLVDSIHVRIEGTQNQYSVTKTKSLLDIILSPLVIKDEKTYSSPLATHLHSQSLITTPSGKQVRGYPELQHTKNKDIEWRVVFGVIEGLAFLLVIIGLGLLIQRIKTKRSMKKLMSLFFKGQTDVAWREMAIALGLVSIVIFVVGNVGWSYHIFGTDKVGQDVFYQSMKSIRTGLMIGILTTIFMLPFALILGMLAGYFRGWVDDLIQYAYTTLSSIPGVLLISATILVMQVYISNHPHLFPTIAERADARLLVLCFILGITSWAGLCRLLRGETLKIREMDFVSASKALSVSNIKILFRHIMPNIMHIVLITIVLDFSGLVLAEAVLSYVGVGVDPTTFSWGNMINSSRLELAREPVVWWPLLAALIFMFVLVLAANLFADSVRDALDPRLRVKE
jgi:peptide/nickel transport system permease protein